MPLVKLILMGFNDDTGWTLQVFTNILHEPRTIAAIKNTIYIAVISSFLATIAGLILAFFAAYTNICGKSILEILTLSPLVIPSYIIAISWAQLLDKNGIIYNILLSLKITPVDVYSIGGIIFVMGICHIPIVYLVVINAMRRVPRDLEWAARLSGCSIGRTMLKINLPLIMPTVINGFILSFLSAVDNFAIPAFLGISSNIPVLSTYIYEKTIGFGPASFHIAAAVSMILAVIAVSVTLLQQRFAGKTFSFIKVKEDFSARVLFTGTKKKMTETGLFFVMGLLMLMPLLATIAVSIQKGIGTGFALSNLSLSNFDFLLKNDGAHNAIINSLFFAFATFWLCVIFGGLCAFWDVRKDSRTAKLCEQVFSVYYAVPGIVIALAMIFYWNKVSYVYGTPLILIIGYFTRYIVMSVKTSKTAFSSLPQALEEAGKIYGGSTLYRWKEIILPLMWRPILSGSSIIFILALTEVSMSSILASAGTTTIGLFIFNLQQAGDYNIAGAMSVVVLLMLLMIYIIGKWLLREKEKDCLTNERLKSL